MPQSSLSPAQGFHVDLTTVLEASDCPLCVLYVLPPSFIVDRHQLLDRLREGYLHSSDAGAELVLHSSHDIERPVHAVPAHDSAILLKLGPTSNVTVSVPLHLRYQQPATASKARSIVSASAPLVIRSCPGDPIIDRCVQSVTPPAAWTDLPKHGVLLEPGCSRPLLSVSIPVGDAHDFGIVSSLNTALIFGLAIWVGWAALGARERLKSKIH